MRTVLLAVVLSGCGSAVVSEHPDASSQAPDAAIGMPDSSSQPPDAAPDAATPVDVDGDGLDDGKESAWAAEYFPFYGIHPNDKCKTHGIVYRLSPHPKTNARIMIWYDVLYDADCGASGHDGDDEMFGVVADPSRSGSAGILAIRAISHQGTPCEHVTTCGTCTGLTACGTGLRNGAMYPAVYSSVDKHGSYADKATCDSSFLCDFGGCGAGAADAPSFVNAGEPGKPLMNDLTTQGFITAQNGWTHMELFHFDPWKPGNFGGAGDVSKDLVDPAFVVDCP
jgi:hypothetical protein